MIKQHLNPNQSADNTLSVNTGNVCCPTNLPSINEWEVETTGGADITALTSATLTFKYSDDGDDQTVTLENMPFATDQDARKEIASKLESVGFCVDNKDDINIDSDTIELKIQAVMVNLVSNVGTDPFLAVT